jgi:threonine synthase
MRYASTRGAAVGASLSEALTLGLAPDGGLFVPAEWPASELGALRAAADWPTLAARFLAPFARGDALEGELAGIVREAFDFPLPLVPLARAGAEAAPSALELFHGPTAAFKDFGARFLAAALARLRRRAARPLSILVATSGDTGGAVAAAFHGRPGFEVVVLYPLGLVAPTQERQLTAWGGNVRTFAVRGTFDDCQRMVKAAFADEELCAASELSSANSINLGRLLAQAATWAWASLALERAQGGPASFVVPSGNLGNALACLWARRAGLPIARVVLAHNANRAVPDFLASGAYRPRRSVATLASAMDVGDPSNLERLRHLHPEPAELRSVVRAESVDDDAIRARIRADARRGRVWCPHSACAAEAWARLPAELCADGSWVLGATAHPAKFPETVAPLAGPVEPPDSLARLLSRAGRAPEIEPDPAALCARLRTG